MKSVPTPGRHFRERLNVLLESQLLGGRRETGRLETVVWYYRHSEQK